MLHIVVPACAAITSLAPRLAGATVPSSAFALPVRRLGSVWRPHLEQQLQSGSSGGRLAASARSAREFLFSAGRRRRQCVGSAARASGAGLLRMSSDVASLPIDPTAGSLESKVPAELDRSKLRDVSTVPEGMSPAVLVACGSYSPPTVLHTRIFETARDFFVETKDSLKIDVIGGYICPVHEAYGKKGLAPMHDRIEMVKRSLESSDWVSCDEWETKQKEWTRTRLSLDRMHIEVNKGNTSGKDIRVMLLCGADILDSMVTPGVWTESDLHVLLSRGTFSLSLLRGALHACSSWTVIWTAASRRDAKNRDELASRAGIVCIKRAGSDPEKLINSHDILYKYRQNIYLIREWVVSLPCGG